MDDNDLEEGGQEFRPPVDYRRSGSPDFGVCRSCL